MPGVVAAGRVRRRGRALDKTSQGQERRETSNKSNPPADRQNATVLCLSARGFPIAACCLFSSSPKSHTQAWKTGSTGFTAGSSACCSSGPAVNWQIVASASRAFTLHWRGKTLWAAVFVRSCVFFLSGQDPNVVVSCSSAVTVVSAVCKSFPCRPKCSSWGFRCFFSVHTSRLLSPTDYHLISQWGSFLNKHGAVANESLT